MGEEFIIHSGEDLEELKAAETGPDRAGHGAGDTGGDDGPGTGQRGFTEGFLTELTGRRVPTGSDGELNIGAYIRETMEGYGYTVSEQNFHEGF